MVGPTRTHDAFGRPRKKPLTDAQLEDLTGSRVDHKVGVMTDLTADPAERRRAKAERKVGALKVKRKPARCPP